MNLRSISLTINSEPSLAIQTVFCRERETTDIFSDISLDNIFFWVSEETKKLSSSQVLNNKLEKYLSLSIYKNIYFIHIKFLSFFSTENNCNIIYEGEGLLINLLKPTTKEEKITQFDKNTRFRS